MMHRRHKVFMIRPKDFIAMLRGKKRIFNLPQDAEPLSFQTSPLRKEVGLLVESSTFEPVPITHAIPCVYATMEIVR